MITGRGLFYGAVGSNGKQNIYTEQTWAAECQLAVTRGIQVLHPKVADGGYWWYDNTGLEMLTSVAKAHKLALAPYHYCYGNKFGAIDHEAQICAAVGKICGAVCPDIEVEWDHQAEWAIHFGQMVRSSFKGPIYPTLFANPDQHPTPYAQIMPWIDGWMPMVYFAEWTPNTATHAIGFVYPQWQKLDAQLQAGKIAPKPILPLIMLGNGLPESEVAVWLDQMQDYGYCGFWYHGTYAPYADTILKAIEPHWPSTPPQQPPAQQQELDPFFLSLWRLEVTDLSFDLSHATEKTWVDAVTKGIPIGAPLGDEFTTLTGKARRCKGGDILWDSKTSSTRISLH